MNFDNNKPIYIQIADNICEKVLSGALEEGGRIPSVREWAAEIGVNPNTVARSYDLLVERGVIFIQRGIGYFTVENARETVKESERQKFIDEDLPQLLKRAELLGIDIRKYLPSE